MQVQRPDGRRLRSTKRTISWGTRVTEEFRITLDRVAKETGMMYCEVLERALFDLDLKLTRERAM